VAGTRPTLLVRPKADLSPATPGGGLPVSVVAGTGLGELRHAATQQVFGDRVVLADLEPALGRARQRTALARARAALGSALELFRGERDAVLVAHHVRDATAALDELIGTVDVEDVLDRVFASFCVGK
jgi:tRNA modification GTPase